MTVDGQEQRANVDALEECHRRLARLLGAGAEPIEVLQRAEEQWTRQKFRGGTPRRESVLLPTGPLFRTPS